VAASLGADLGPVLSRDTADRGRRPQPRRAVADLPAGGPMVRRVDEQRHDTTTGEPRHRAPGEGPDDHRFPSVRRRADAAPLADPAWLGRLRADARSAGRGGPPPRVGSRDGGSLRDGRGSRDIGGSSGDAGPVVARAALPVGVHRPRVRPRSARGSATPTAGPGVGVTSRWRAAAAPLAALAVVVAATITVLGAVDRGGRAVSAEAAFAMTPRPSASAVVPRSSVTVTPETAVPSLAAVVATASPEVEPPLAATRARESPAEVPDVLVTGTPLRALQALQAVRGTAFATGRLDLLRGVYPPGSRLVTEDRAAFTRLAPAGGTVVGLGFDLREVSVSEQTPVRAIVIARVRQRPIDLVVPGSSATKLPGRELGRVRVVLTRPAVTDPWVIAVSTPIGPR